MEQSLPVSELIERARRAQREMDVFTQEQVDAVVRAIARTVYDNAEEFARLAVEETGLGRYEDKVKKNRGKASIIWWSLKGERSVGVLSRDSRTGIAEVARPVGVVGAVTPCTNPIVTPMCNAMFALKGRNAIILAPHPRAKKCCRAFLDRALSAICPLGAPDSIIQMIDEPTNELSSELMRSVDVVVATGGMGMVKAAYGSGKPAFGVGVGNVQCILDRGMGTADTVKKIIDGRAFDNGIICSGEQTVIAHESEYEAVLRLFEAEGCAVVREAAAKQRLRETLFPGGVMSKYLVGISAAQVARAAGIDAPEGIKALLVEADGYGIADVFSHEKMCPVISTYWYKDISEAVVIAQANLDVDGRGHSVSLHTQSEEVAEYVANTATVCRVLVNQVCSTMNGGSFFNGLTPTTTLGCGSWGNNSLSANLGYRNFLNITRIAYCRPENHVPDEAELWG